MSTNGGITLCPITSFICNSIPFTADGFPLNGGGDGLLGVYWADVDTSGGAGNVWFHQGDPENRNNFIIDTINEYVELAFMQDGFVAVDFMIATWENVGYFDRNSDKVNHV